MKTLKQISNIFVDAAILSGWLIGVVIISLYVYPPLGIYLEHLGG